MCVHTIDKTEFDKNPFSATKIRYIIMALNKSVWVLLQLNQSSRLIEFKETSISNRINWPEIRNVLLLIWNHFYLFAMSCLSLNPCCCSTTNEIIKGLAFVYITFTYTLHGILRISRSQLNTPRKTFLLLLLPQSILAHTYSIRIPSLLKSLSSPLISYTSVFYN